MEIVNPIQKKDVNPRVVKIGRAKKKNEIYVIFSKPGSYGHCGTRVWLTPEMTKEFITKLQKVLNGSS